MVQILIAIYSLRTNYMESSVPRGYGNTKMIKLYFIVKELTIEWERKTRKRV